MLNLKKEDENKKNFTETEAFSFIQNQFSIIMIVSIVVQINFLIMQLFFGKSSLILTLLVTMFPIATYLVFKDCRKNKDKSVSFYFKIMLVLMTMMITNHICLDFLSALTGGKETGLYKLLFMFDFGLMIASVGVYSQEGFRDFIDKIDEKNYSEKMVNNKEEEIKLGDAIIGYEADPETDEMIKPKKPVILPLKDRFLHMLILGPTGSGKTSQSVIPMINRDMSNKDMGIIVLEPKGDLAEKIYAMAKYYEREVLYFNPILPDCPYFNPLHGKESDVVENMATTFNMLNPDSPQFFKDMTDGLIRRGIKMLKRLKGDDATLIDLNTLVWDTNGAGRKMVMSFSRIKHPHPDTNKENEDITAWFLNDYYSGMSGARGGTKTYEHCSGVRSQISKLISNKYLRKVLNPPEGQCSDIDFDDALERGIVVTMGTAQGALRELGRFLGYFIILQLQASVFRRPGNENTRRACMLYIDEFQVYSNPGFADMLTMGRSYRVASHLATQAREQIGMGSGKDGKAFIQLVSTNARNKIIYPGVSYQDAKYYSEEFGEVMRITESKTYGKKRYFSTLGEERVSTAVKEELEERFSPSRIIYKEFGKITYCLIKKNSIQAPGVSEIEYIPYELNQLLDKMVSDYNDEQFAKDQEAERALEECLREANFNGVGGTSPTENAMVKPLDVTTESGAFIDPIAVTTGAKNPMSPVSTDTFSYSNDNDDIFMDSAPPTVIKPSIPPLNPTPPPKPIGGNSGIGNDLDISDDFDDII